eukprot:jgi/Undpi1/3194/HiC_scaffold_15.g06568.m1
MAMLVPTTTASTSSPVSKDEAAPPSAPLEPASTSDINDDLGIIITDQDFCEVADIFAADDGTVEFPPPGTAPAAGIAAGDDKREAGNRLASLSLSSADLGDELRRLWEENPVADLPTAAVESATSSPPTLTIAVGNDANDREAGNADSASSTTPAPTVDQPRHPPIVPSCPNSDNEASTTAPDQDTDGPDTVTAPAAALLAGNKEVKTSSKAAVVGTSTLSATPLPFIPSASTTEAASATVGAPIADENSARNGGDTHGVGDSVAKATSTTLSSGQGGGEAEARAERSGVAKFTLSATAKPFAPSSYTREAASAARETWMKSSAVILAKAKEKAVADARAELGATVGGTPEERR